MTDAKCRAYVIVARRAPRAVVLRRGPSGHVGVFLWHLDTDRVEEGQWLRGRIYERRCDLSPDGKHFIYFAAKWETPLATWTAVSRPPWLTALALWPKGDAWGGGGLFDTDASISLNHSQYQSKLAEGALLPRHVTVRTRGGGGEDAPLWHARLLRDGWVHERGGESPPDFTREVTWRFDPPQRWRRVSPTDRGRVLTMKIHGVNERGGDWYVVDHAVEDGDEVLDLGRSEWADWASSGDLLFARDGVLHRLRRADGLRIERARVVADLRESRFVARASPKDARRW